MLQGKEKRKTDGKKSIFFSPLHWQMIKVLVMKHELALTMKRSNLHFLTKRKDGFAEKKEREKKRKVEEITPISFSQPPCFFHALNSTSKHRGAESHPLVRGWEAFSFFVGNTAMLRRAPERSETQMLISGNLVKKRKKRRKDLGGVVVVGWGGGGGGVGYL